MLVIVLLALVGRPWSACHAQPPSDANTLPSVEAAPTPGLPPMDQLPQPGNESPAGAPVGSPFNSAADPSATRIPPFHLTRVDLTGLVEGDRARLDVGVEISINHGEGWHRVPLRLNQAHVWRYTYQGSGSEAPVVDSSASDEGVVWMLRGIGMHALKLSIWVPLNRNLGEERLVLNLPPLPPQFESTLKLLVPNAPLTFRPAREITVLENSSGEAGASLSASIAGNRLDLAWRAATASETGSALVRTNLTLRRAGSRLGLVADQVLQFDGNIPKQLRIRLPQDFRLLGVSGAAIKDQFTLDPRDAQYVLAPLAEVQGDRTEIRLLLDAELPPAGGEFTVEGFEVDQAGSQDGVIRIEDFGSYQVRVRAEDLEQVQRIDPITVQGSGGASVLSAYKFSRQPFQLHLDVVPITPSLTVNPQHTLRVSGDSLSLASKIRVDVDSGAAQRVVLHWPDSMGTWNILTAAVVIGAGEVPVSMSALDDARWEVTFPQPLSGTFEISLLSQRRLNATTDPVVFQLPKVESARQAAGRLLVEAEDRLETAIEARPAEAAIQTAVPVEPIGPSAAVPQHALRLLSADVSLELRTSVHELTVAADVAVHIDEVSADGLQIRQSTELDVSHGRLEALTLEIPQLLAPQDVAALPFAVEASLDGRVLTPRVVAEDQLLLSFPASVRGTAQLDLVYRLPLDGSKTSEPQTARDVTAPILKFAAGNSLRVESTRCIIHPAESVRVTDDPAWSELNTAPDGVVWVAREAVTQIPLKISTTFADEAQQFYIEQAFLRSRFYDDGKCLTLAAYVIQSPARRLLLRCPKGLELDALRVDGQPVPTTDILRKPFDNSEDAVTVVLPKSDSPRRNLQFQFTSLLGGRFGLAHTAKLDIPYFAAGVWTNETTWEVVLPPGHHLFLSPPGTRPEFRWTRTGLIWRRLLTPAYQEYRQRWVSLDPQFAAENFEGCYAFQQLGPIRQFEVRSMNRSLILLTGAGTSLLLGFLMWRFPFTRNLFTLVCVAFAFAVASLWYLEPILLLLQPAALGLLLAVLATALEVLRRPPAAAAPISVQSASAPMRPSTEERRGVATGSSLTHIPSTLYRPVSSSDPSGSQR